MSDYEIRLTPEQVATEMGRPHLEPTLAALLRGTASEWSNVEVLAEGYYTRPVLRADDIRGRLIVELHKFWADDASETVEAEAGTILPRVLRDAACLLEDTPWEAGEANRGPSSSAGEAEWMRGASDGIEWAAARLRRIAREIEGKNA